MIPSPIDHAAVVAAFPEFEVDPEPLGEGGFKTAYRARQQDKAVVLKVIRQPLVSADDEEETITLPTRIMREIEGMRAIDHARVVRILDGPDKRQIDGADRGWYLEPHYPGGTLADRLGQPWAADDGINLACQLIEAIDVLRQHGIVHRDVKPSNIVFDADDKAVLLDLGIAYFIDQTPITNPLGGSPRTDGFAAPEQFVQRGQVQIDWRTDLYLVGLTVFVAFTGVHPFHPELEDYLDRLMAGTIDATAMAKTAVPEGIQKWLQRCLAVNRSHRYRTPDGAMRAIEECR